ncbi:phage protein NinX family protein [Providencia rettgeri]
MNKYTELSDFKINRRIAVMIHKYSDFIEQYDNKTIYVDGNIFDPCKNPADAMPIIIDNNISLRAPTITDRWKAEFIDEYGNYVGYRRAMNKNPLRAAMELFLLMKDAENENNNNG